MNDLTTVELPAGASVHDTKFTRHGSNLELTGPDGEVFVIDGYFAHDVPPDLLTSDGARLSPRLVQSFLHADHTDEYASNGEWTTTDESAVAQVEALDGEAWVTRADGTRHPLEHESPVFEGDVIETGPDGAVALIFPDNSSFAISEGARLSVDEFSYDTAAGEGTSFFSILRGAFLYTSGLIGKDDPGDVNIETPVGSLGIRGTVVAGRINPPGEDSQITILDGAVVITNAAGSFEIGTRLETLQFSSYTQPAIALGQLDAAVLESDYGSLASVASDSYRTIIPGIPGETPGDADSDEADVEGKDGDAPDILNDPKDTDDKAERQERIQELREKRAEQAEQNDDVAEQAAEAEHDIESSGGDIIPQTDLAIVEPGDAFTGEALQVSREFADHHPGILAPPAHQPPSSPTAGDADYSGTNSAPVNFDPVFDPVSAADLATNLYFGVGEKITNVNGDPLRIAAADGNVNQTLTYSIVGGDGQPFFDIDSRTGELLAAQTLDGTTVNAMGQRSLQIEARDSLGATDTVTVTLDLSANPVGGNVAFGDENDNVTQVQNSASFFGFGGNDVVNFAPAAGQQSVWGGEGQDTFAVQNTLFNLIDGGSGFDTSALQGSGSSFDFTTSDKVNNIEHIATNGNMVTLTYADLIDMTGPLDTLLIDGGGTANVDISGHNGFVKTREDVGVSGQGTEGSGNFDTYSDGLATLIINNDVATNLP